MTDLGATVFAAIIPSNREALEYALQRLSLDHFRDGIQRTFWKVVESFGERYGDVFPFEHLANLLAGINVDQAKVLLYAEFYASYAEREVSESSFRYAVDALRAELNKRQTGEILTTSYDILEQGQEVEGEFLSGDEAARNYFQTRIAVVEERAQVEETPEGDIRTEGARILDLYEAAAASHEAGETNAITFGITALDHATGGVQPGELCIFAAYTNEGKSQLTAQTAWTACVEQGKNVFFATSETVRDTTMRRILARHSRLPQFGLPHGLNSKDIQFGRLTPDERTVYHDVVHDFTTNSSYGMCYISQLPRSATVGLIDHRATRVNRTRPLDLLCIDYLQLLVSDRVAKSAGEREMFNDILRSTKVLAPSFGGGKGIAIISPWQIKQSEYKAALSSMAYTLGALADTSESEKSPDLVITLLRPNPTSQEGNVQVPKNRDGPILAASPIYLDYRSTYLGDSPSGYSAEDSGFGFGTVTAASTIQDLEEILNAH